MAIVDKLRMTTGLDWNDKKQDADVLYGSLEEFFEVSIEK